MIHKDRKIYKIRDILKNDVSDESEHPLESVRKIIKVLQKTSPSFKLFVIYYTDGSTNI